MLRRGRVCLTLPSGRYIVTASPPVKPGDQVDISCILEVQFNCARNDVQRFLSHSERSSGQLKKKVITLGYSSEVAEATVKWATEYGLVDDHRFCSIFISSRVMGRRRLEIELMRRGVSPAVVEAVLSETSETEYTEALCKQVAKRYGTIENSETARRRAFGWLSRRGFSSSTIHRVLKEVL